MNGMKRNRSGALRLAAVVLGGACAAVFAPVAAGAADDFFGDPFPLTKCVVQESELEEGGEIFDLGNREIRVCCDQCIGHFNDDKERWLAEADRRIIKQQKTLYPLKTCVVDGKPLEAAGVLDTVVLNRHFRVCGEACRRKLKAAPAKHFAKLNQAVIAEQKAAYPLKTSVVSDKPLGGAAIDHVAGNQLVRLANEKEIDKFEEEPGRYLKKLRDLAKNK